MIHARDLIMVTIGMLVSLALQTRNVCVECVERARWKDGRDPGMPPTKPHTMTVLYMACNGDRHFFNNPEVGSACNCSRTEIVLERGVRVVRPSMTPPAPGPIAHS